LTLEAIIHVYQGGKQSYQESTTHEKNAQAIELPTTSTSARRLTNTSARRFGHPALAREPLRFGLRTVPRYRFDSDDLVASTVAE